MVFGYHLFLKEMPRCFRFREDDMNSFPAWVQIHGLPPDCWNYKILSKLASKIGNPIHMDMLTHDRKRVKYARVLVEIDTSKPKIAELNVRLPIGIIAIKLEYEHDIPICDNCHRAGHATSNCSRIVHSKVQNETVIEENSGKNNKRIRSASTAGRKTTSRGRSHMGRIKVDGSSRSAEPKAHQSPLKDASTAADKGKSPMLETIDTAHGKYSEPPVIDEGYKVVTNKKKNKKTNKKESQTSAAQKAAMQQRAAFFNDMEDTGTQFVHYFDLNSKGRIFVLWNPLKIKVDILRITEQSIHAKVECLVTKRNFCTSFVYGFNTIVQRRDLWDDLKSFGTLCNLPWIVMGDFNNVLSQHEKKGGLQVKNYETKDFVDCVASLDLLDLQHTGCYFTWSSPSVCSKLDRVLVNQAWHSSNFHGLVEFVAPSCISDHALALVSVCEQRKQQSKPFKFFNMWTLHNDFQKLIRDRWTFFGYGTAQYVLKQKFVALKKPLQSMNKYSFSSISARATAMKNKLENLQLRLLKDGIRTDEYAEVKRRTEILLEAERMFIA
ncbi:uncharacterized protein [Primulina eburnea]|uniref:uncharacterized protein n=1 Tax=Primulina eburnea TaxID=1245227 RepID=UPI003C6C8EF3